MPKHVADFRNFEYTVVLDGRMFGFMFIVTQQDESPQSYCDLF